MSGACPPSSMLTFLTVAADWRSSCLPTAVEPAGHAGTRPGHVAGVSSRPPASSAGEAELAHGRVGAELVADLLIT